MIVTSPVKSQDSRLRRIDFPAQGKSAPAIKSAESISEKKGMAPWKIVLGSLLLGVAGYFYISHVFTTQNILREVTVLQREYDAAVRMYEDRALTYDRMTGPAEVYRRAIEIGLIHGGANDPIIWIKE